MIGGLSRTGRLAVAAIFCAVGGMPGMEERAEAADLGGDCCADLEERVADLEATTARKGNKKVSVELYGRVNRQINFWDDGSESNAYVLNNSYSTTRFGIRGKGKTGVSDVNAIYVIEIEQFADQTRFANQFNDNPLPSCASASRPLASTARSTEGSGSACRRWRRTTSTRTPSSLKVSNRP
jgi:hypothetical protein